MLRNKRKRTATALMVLTIAIFASIGVLNSERAYSVEAVTQLNLDSGCEPSNDVPCIVLKADRALTSQIRGVFQRKNTEEIESLYKLYDFTDFRDYSGRNILHLAIYVDDAKILQQWINKYCHLLNEVNTKGFTPLFRAVRVNASHSVLTLLDEGADISVRTHRAKINVVESCQTILSEHGKWAACEVLQEYNYKKYD